MPANSSYSAGAASKSGVEKARTLGEVRLLGYRFHPRTKSELLDLVFDDRAPGEQLTIASANLHGLFMFERFAEYRGLHARDDTHVIVDGMPIVWLLRWFGHDVQRQHRTTWMDWFEDALDRAARTGKRVFILGHTPAALDAGLARAHERWPELAIAGVHGFFDTEDPVACRGATEAINRFAPHVVFIGMGMPRQEIFAARYARTIEVPVIGLGGAAFAYFAGDQAAPPRWMGQAGLEWLHRLFHDPRRLATRYFVEPLVLCAALSLRLLRERQRGPSASSSANLR